MFGNTSAAFTPETLVIHRFLHKLSAETSSDPDSRWRSDPRFHHSVKALLDLIDGAEHTLSANAHSHDTTFSRLQEFKSEARGIRDMLNVPAQPSYIDPCRDNGDVIDAEASAYSAAQERAFSALRSPAGPNSILQNAQGLSKDAQNRLVSHEGIQEDLTDQMVSLASKLKEQAQAQAHALHHRDEVLASASQGLLKSVQGVQAVVKDTKQAVKRTRRSMFFSFFVLLTVAAVFLGVYGFINVTAVTKMFVPYKTMASQWASSKLREAKEKPKRAAPIPQTPASLPRADPISDLEIDLVSQESDTAITQASDTKFHDGQMGLGLQGVGVPHADDEAPEADNEHDAAADSPELSDAADDPSYSAYQTDEDALYAPGVDIDGYDEPEVDQAAAMQPDGADDGSTAVQQGEQLHYDGDGSGGDTTSAASSGTAADPGAPADADAAAPPVGRATTAKVGTDAYDLQATDLAAQDADANVEAALPSSQVDRSGGQDSPVTDDTGEEMAQESAPAETPSDLEEQVDESAQDQQETGPGEGAAVAPVPSGKAVGSHDASSDEDAARADLGSSSGAVSGAVADAQVEDSPACEAELNVAVEGAADAQSEVAVELSPDEDEAVSAHTDEAAAVPRDIPMEQPEAEPEAAVHGDAAPEADKPAAAASEVLSTDAPEDSTRGGSTQTPPDEAAAVPGLTAGESGAASQDGDGSAGHSQENVTSGQGVDEPGDAPSDAAGAAEDAHESHGGALAGGGSDQGEDEYYDPPESYGQASGGGQGGNELVDEPESGGQASGLANEREQHGADGADCRAPETRHGDKAAEEEDDEYYDEPESADPLDEEEAEEEEDEYYDEPDSADDASHAEDRGGDGADVEDGDEDEDEYADDDEESGQEQSADGSEEADERHDAQPDDDDRCSADGTCGSVDTELDPRYAREVEKAREWASNADVGVGNNDADANSMDGGAQQDQEQRDEL
eukprot:jgi/Ulvmu1/5604/UM023_0141.1